MTAEKDREQEKPPLIQWIVAVIGAVLFIACFGTISWFAATASDLPPHLTVVADSTRAGSTGYIVTVTVRNDIGATAANVLIRGELLDGDSVVESSQFELDYVPTRSERHGGLFFTHDPGAYRLELSAAGYREP